RAVAIAANDQYFIGPDNGIFSYVLHANDPKNVRAYELNVDKYWRQEISTSFHARDLFAPVSAHFAAGVELDQLGEEIDVASLTKLAARELRVKQNRVEGTVAYVDRFGNLITNIKRDYVQNAALCQVGKRSIGRIGHSYSSGDLGMPVAFIGSHGFLEIA